MARSTWLVLLSAALACSSSHRSGPLDVVPAPDAGSARAGAAAEPEPGAADGGPGFDAALDDGGANVRPRELVARECGAQPFGPDVEIVPGLFCRIPRAGDAPQCTSGIECMGPWDCQAVPFARCLGQTSDVCVYPDREPGLTQPAPCDTDTDCAQRAGGRCIRAITHAVCQYNAQCEQDADCGPDARCACGLSGDLICVTAQCRADADCPGQQCKRDYACGYPIGGFFCTRPDDPCRSDGDCGMGRCEFDETMDHWQCSNTPPCTLP